MEVSDDILPSSLWVVCFNGCMWCCSLFAGPGRIVFEICLLSKYTHQRFRFVNLEGKNKNMSKSSSNSIDDGKTTTATGRRRRRTTTTPPPPPPTTTTTNNNNNNNNFGLNSCYQGLPFSKIFLQRMLRTKSKLSSGSVR